MGLARWTDSSQHYGRINSVLLFDERLGEQGLLARIDMVAVNACLESRDINVQQVPSRPNVAVQEDSAMNVFHAASELPVLFRIGDRDMENFVAWIGISITLCQDLVDRCHRPGEANEVIGGEFSDERKCCCRERIIIAGVVHGDATSVGRREDETGAVGFMVIVDMEACDLQLVVESIYAGDSWIVAPMMRVEAEIEGVAVGCRHAARLRGIVDGVGSFVEWKELQNLTLCGDS